MKREGNLIERIADPKNLRLAFWKARKGKDNNSKVEAFREQLDQNLLTLRCELLSGRVDVGNYTYFTIKDPKERLICAAVFKERVLHHSLMNVCHDNFERFQIFDSYATRPGKGQYAALERAKLFTRRYGWFCKMDVRKFFDSIDQSVLKKQLGKRFKDPLLLNAFAKIIDSYAHTTGVGLPIGNLTSQYFANFYLGHADHYVREILQAPAYIRYMDDMVLWHNDKAELIRITNQFTAFIAEKLKLILKPICLNNVEKGVPLLGYVLFPQMVRLNKTSKKRFIRKYKSYHAKYIQAEWNQAEYAQHILPLIAFTRHANALAFRQALTLKMEAG